MRISNRTPNWIIFDFLMCLGFLVASFCYWIYEERDVGGILFLSSWTMVSLVMSMFSWEYSRLKRLSRSEEKGQSSPREPASKFAKTVGFIVVFVGLGLLLLAKRFAGLLDFGASILTGMCGTILIIVSLFSLRGYHMDYFELLKIAESRQDSNT